MFCENYDRFVNELESRGFTVHSAQTGEEAKEIVLKLIGAAFVGCGGSMTVSSLDLPAALRQQGSQVYFHWEVDPEDRPAIFSKASAADWYLCSANAITADAKILNIDGNGNRVSAMFNGPSKVVLVVGKNKYAENVSEGYRRIKEVACVKNAQRFGLQTPCALTGKCVDCKSPQRLCNITTMIEAKPKFVQEMHIVLVDENLGY